MFFLKKKEAFAAATVGGHGYGTLGDGMVTSTASALGLHWLATESLLVPTLVVALLGG